jgi:valacyclovir hydrolase
VDLLQHLKVKSAHMMGFSDGGEVAILMAIVAPNCVRSVLTWGSVGKISDPDGQLRNAMYNVVDNPIPPMRPFREYLVSAYGESNARSMTQSFTSAMTEIVDAGGNVSLDKADKITCPVYLITGEHDPFAPPAGVSELASRINGAEMITVKDAGHDVHHSHTDWLVKTLLDWVKKH